MMSTSTSPPYASHGRSLPQTPFSFNMAVNNTLPQPWSIPLFSQPHSKSLAAFPLLCQKWISGTLPRDSHAQWIHILASAPPPSSLGDMKKLIRSSVSHLRNLSEFKNMNDTVYGLGIAEIDTEEIPGTAGPVLPPNRTNPESNRIEPNPVEPNHGRHRHRFESLGDSVRSIRSIG